MTQKAVLWLAVSTTAQAAEDKASLAQQEADARAACAQHGWRIVDVLRVPGHSRNYIDIHEAAHDMRAEGIDAFDKLLAHWRAADFDVLVCRDGSRFARTQSLHAYVVERTISTGAMIYSLVDGVIDSSNYRMWVSMAGFKSAGEVDDIRRRHRMGTDALVKRGLPANGKVSEAHTIIRNPDNGKMLRVELNPEKTQEWMHLAELLLEGVPYYQLPPEMHRRFGYTAFTGKQHNPIHYYRLLQTPSFWGHSGRRVGNGGQWAWDESTPAPDGVTLIRNTHEPVYTGELAERIKAEMRRRTEIVGKASPKSRRFSNLFRCRHCGWGMSYATHKYKDITYLWLRCNTQNGVSYVETCANRRHIRESDAAEAVRLTLEALKRHGLLALEADADTAAEKASELENTREELKRTEQQLRNLIQKQTSVDASASYIYDEMISAQAERLKILQTRQRELQALFDGGSAKAEQRRAAADLKELNIDDVMQWPEAKLNQLLHRLMGRHRWFVLDGEVVGIGIPVRKPRKRGQSN